MMRAQVATALTLAVAALFASCGGGGGGDDGGGVGGGDVGVGGPAACTPSGLTDSAIHAPPIDGPFAYSPPGTWLPSSLVFPALNGSYVDPIFGSTIRRITEEFPRQSASDIYATNGWWNADASLFVQRTSGADWFAIKAATAEVFRGVPGGTGEVSFDPVDPNVWYHYEVNQLWQFNVATGNASLMKEFATTAVDGVGGSVDWIDRSGRYFLVAYSGAVQVWDRASDIIYANPIPFDALSGGWAGISPDGQYVVTATDVGFISYVIDHNTRMLSSGTMFWNLCGDHGDLISASDGKTYLVTFECHTEAAVYLVDITKPQTIGDPDRQRAENRLLIDTAFEDGGHFSCVSSGLNRDWCFVSLEAQDDFFLDPGPSWRPYKQEIVALQVVPPFAVRRLAHHRSRSTFCPLTCFHSGGYYHQPRPSASWDGRRVAFLSNFGYDAGPTTEYSDVYVLEFCARSSTSAKWT
jgi:hypothetical protein